MSQDGALRYEPDQHRILQVSNVVKATHFLKVILILPVPK